MAVTCNAGDAIRAAIIGFASSSIARTGENRVELGLKHRFDEAAHPVAQASFDRIKPVVKKIGGVFSSRLCRTGLHDIVLHGVVSFRRSNAG